LASPRSGLTYDQNGERKGYAYPSLAKLARKRSVDERTIRRHLATLERVNLTTREQRAGRTSIVWIEEPYEGETRQYLSSLPIGPDMGVGGREDTDVRPYRKENPKKTSTKSKALLRDIDLVFWPGPHGPRGSMSRPRPAGTAEHC
jgi:hypothetical protein